MQIKMVGIGKCGVRIAYDLFAYTRNLRTSYEIRLNNPERAIVRTLRTFRAAIKALVDAHGLYRIAQEPVYVTIDSDSANNEIVNNVILENSLEDGEERGQRYQFRGRNFGLNNYKGGCNFHVISESIARQWKDIPSEIVDNTNISVYATSFSIGGGTGGGSAPIICSLSRGASQNRDLCHYMGLGVLPKSDEPYFESDTVLVMPDYEKFSTGRFLVSVYGNRVDEGMNSLWLFSNDILRFLVSSQVEKGVLAKMGGEMNLNLSYINFFIAQSLTVLANSSSTVTISDSNLDPKELNDFLNGRPFISAMSRRTGGDFVADIDHRVVEVKMLLRAALSNPKGGLGQLEGLSVPVADDDLDQLRKLLNDPSANYREFVDTINCYDADEGPIEFRTTYRLVILYGQPQDRTSEVKKEMIAQVCEKVFPNSQKLIFPFRHHSDTETLLLLLVDPFIRPVVSAMYYYANSAWGASGENLNVEFDGLISAETFSGGSCERLFNKSEEFPERIYGGGVRDILNRIKQDSSVVVSSDHMVRAFRHLHEIYNRKRPTTNTSSALGKRKT